MINKPKRILAIRLSAMGDVAISVPVIDAMRKQHPEIDLYILSNTAFAPFFENIEGVKFIGIKLKDYKGLKGLYRLYKELSIYGFDLIVDLHNVIRSKFIRWFFRFSGVKSLVINKGRKEKKALTRRKNKKLVQLETSAERYADVFRKARFELILDFKTIYPNGVDLTDKVKELLGSVETKKIGIAPYAMHTGKIYPLERTDEVIQYLADRGITVYLFGGRNEADELNNRAAKYSNCITVAGKLSFKEELQLISQLDVMLTMDSGNMHLASLVDTPVVSVWGATHPYAGFYGWGQKLSDAVQIDLLCRPCSVYGSKPCYRKGDDEYACMKLISPQMVIDKLNYYI